jgi:aubergine-like protein
MYCKLVEFGKDRAYFDFEQLSELRNYNLKIAPGYKASLDMYGEKMLLCTEVAHKLFNFNTVWQEMERIYAQDGANYYKEKCMEKFVGNTVMTQYNKKTYRIDDITWDVKPSDTFEKKGKPITYIQYYYDQYGLKIQQTEQPMLVAMIKNKDRRPGKNNEVTERTVLLIPELCVLTGTVLLKGFERDFQMKKDLDAITKLNPEVRYQKLRGLLNRINNQPEAQQNLKDWQMDISDDVVKVNATALATVTVCFANNNTISNTERGWNNSLRNAEHLVSIYLKNWVLFYMPRDEQKANYLNDEIVTTGRAMSFQIEHGQL